MFRYQGDIGLFSSKKRNGVESPATFVGSTPLGGGQARGGLAFGRTRGGSGAAVQAGCDLTLRGAKVQEFRKLDPPPEIVAVHGSSVNIEIDRMDGGFLA